MKKNRLFSLLLCAALVLSMLPIPAAAATISVADETELLAALTNGSADDITLTADISISTTVSLSYSETINFDSHTLTMDGRIDVGSGKTLTLTGPGTFDGTTITGYGAVRATGGTVNVNGGLAMTFTGTSCIQMSSGEVNVTNGTLSGATYGVSSSGGAITVSGGSVSGTTYGIATSGGTTSISGGTVEGGSSAVYTYGGTVGISSGTLNGTTADVYMTDGIVNVTGATLGDSTYGITMSGGTANVTSGTVSGTTYGINATGGLVNVSGTGSVSGDNTGIYANGGDVNVSGGSVSGPVGIDVSSVTSDIDVYGGTVTGTGTYGITTSSGTVDVYGTGSVSGNNTSIDANGGDVNVSGGTVSGPMGINVRNSNSDLVVSAGTVTGSGSFGIGLSYGTATVSGGSITGDTAGIYKSGGTLTVSNGTVTGPNAIRIGGGSATISGGNLVGATNDVYMTDGSVNINGVSLSGANYGINATGGTITMNSGSVTGTTDGVNMTGTAVLNGWGGTITNGITAADTGTVRVRDDVVSDTIGNITITGTATNVYTVTYYDKGDTYDIWYIAEGDTPILTVPDDITSGYPLYTVYRDYPYTGTNGWSTTAGTTYTAHSTAAITADISLYAWSTQSTLVYGTLQDLAKSGTDLIGWVMINLRDPVSGEDHSYIDTYTRTLTELGVIDADFDVPDLLQEESPDGDGNFNVYDHFADGVDTDNVDLNLLYNDPTGRIDVDYDGNGTYATRSNYYDEFADSTGYVSYDARELLIEGDTNATLAVTTDAGSLTAPTKAGHATAVSENPEYLITAQPYRFSFVLETLDGTSDDTFTVKWYKIRGDYKITSTAPTLLSVTTHVDDGVYYADITVDESYYYFAVISDNTDYFNTDPAVTGYDYATLGSTAADTYDNDDRPYDAFVQQTYITSNIQVVSTTNYIVSGTLTTTEAATEFTVGSTYHLEVPDGSVKDAQGYELTEGTDYDVTYQIAQNGWDWQDIGTNVVTPANTTCMYRAKITPADGSKYVGTYYTNTIL
ncbi:MAG: beta strand repeat-containing protein, partial [Oscillospiraceae bacterium]